MNNMTTFALNNYLNSNTINMALKQQKSQTQRVDTLTNLRERAFELVEQTESEELLAEVVGILSGAPFPCRYSHEQMETSLQEAELDYQEKRYVSHLSICEQYGV